MNPQNTIPEARRDRRLLGATVSALIVLVLGGALIGGSPKQGAAAAAVATADTPVTHAQNDRVPEGAAWTQHYLPSSDGSDVELHADVLLPEGLAPGQKVPVILSVSSYFGHSGKIAVDGYDHTGPSDRFAPFVEGTRLLDRGYALVLVDLRGFGGSTGCLDFAGPGEQADVKAAIDWAATQPWSTGGVGMYGMSYDAVTALIGNNLNQDALKAVVAQEPLWDPYRNIHSGGVPRSTTVTISDAYNSIAQLPPMPDDDPHYRSNAEYEKAHPECTLINSLQYQDTDPNSEYWKARALTAQAAGSDTPLLITQGFLEWSAEAEAVEEYLANHRGPARGWLGQWDHVQGNDRLPDGRLEAGREGWFTEVMAHYDQYLKGIAPTPGPPTFAIQDSTGAWRAQDAWPVADRTADLVLGGGTYVDDGADAAPGRPAGSFLARSAPLSAANRITGTPRISVDTTGHGNVTVRLYDRAPDGTAVQFDQQSAALRGGTTDLELRSTDWVLPAGHSLAVEIGTIRPGIPFVDDWLDTPSRSTVTVRGARLRLAVDDPRDDTVLPGGRAVFLDTYLSVHTTTLPDTAPTFSLSDG